jgi:hypothetical protein
MDDVSKCPMADQRSVHGDDVAVAGNGAEDSTSAMTMRALQRERFKAGRSRSLKSQRRPSAPP